MKSQNIFTIKELADFLAIHDKVKNESVEYKLPVMDSDFSTGLKLSAVDCSLQDSLLRAVDEDLDRVIHTNGMDFSLANLINEDLIDLDLRVETRNQVLSKLARIAYINRLATSYEELYIELENREKLMSTAIGQGIAIPHSRFPHRLLFRSAKLVIARSSLGVNFGAADGQKAHLFFMPCAQDTFTHVRMLAAIAKMLHIPGIKDQWMKAKNVGELKSLLAHWRV